MGTLSGSGGVRAMIGVNGTGYAVTGRVVHQFEAGGSSSVLGGMPSDGPVTMAVNTIGDVAICCDGSVKIISGGSLVDVTDTHIGTPLSVCCVRDIFVTSGSDGYIRASQILDGTDWDPLDVAKALPDSSQLLKVAQRGAAVVAFGRTSCGVWHYNESAGASGFPFSPGNALTVGCIGAGTVIQAPIITPSLVTDTICWAAADYQGTYAGIVMLDGDTPRKISHTGVDRDFAAVSDPSTITSCAWTSAGHAYVAWTLPGVTTWIYDTATQLWHERQSYGLDHWMVGCTTALNGRVVAGNRASPDLYFIDPDAGDEDGEHLVMTAQTPTAHNFPNYASFWAVYLDCATGVGLNTPSVPATLDPVVSMSMSRDMQNWGTELSRALGRLGDTKKRIAWHGLGSVDHRGASFRFRASAAVVRSFQQAMVDVR